MIKDYKEFKKYRAMLISSNDVEKNKKIKKEMEIFRDKHSDFFNKLRKDSNTGSLEELGLL
jgi:hypothetical protein